MPFLARFHSSF
uniref:Uncharacterized protein n=1 Tax=Arundo donax TaxID=35708 RepID=A0A0A9CRY0_ARUDO